MLTWRDDDARAMLGEPMPTGVDLLRGLVELARINEGRPELIELHVIVSGEGTSAEHPLHAYFVRRYEYIFELFKGAFDEAAERGELRPGVDSAVRRGRSSPCSTDCSCSGCCTATRSTWPPTCGGTCSCW